MPVDHTQSCTTRNIAVQLTPIVIVKFLGDRMSFFKRWMPRNVKDEKRTSGQ